MNPAAFLVLACSGPGAEEAIVFATLIGWACALVSLGATIFVVAKARRSTVTVLRVFRVLALLLLALHPGWWVSALMGDCGQTRLVLAPAVLIAHVGFALIAWRKSAT